MKNYLGPKKKWEPPKVEPELKTCRRCLKKLTKFRYCSCCSKTIAGEDINKRWKETRTLKT